MALLVATSSLKPVDELRSKQVREELAEILYHQPLIAILACQIIGVLVTAAYFWANVSHFELLLWTVSMVILSVVFMTTTFTFRRTVRENRDTQWWITLFLIAGILLGFGWGSTSFLPNVMREADTVVFVTLVSVGMAGAGIVALAPYYRAYAAYVLSNTLCFTVVLFLQNTGLHYALAVMVMAYSFVLLAGGYFMKQAVRQSINLRLDKIELVAELERKNTEAEQARISAEQADRAKSKFLAAASHDLRQPLHALGLFVSSLETHKCYPEVQETVDNIRISTDALSDLFSALLDVSKLDAGLLEPKPSDFMLGPLFQRIRTDYSDQAREKGIELKIIDSGCVTHTDPSMLERILRNLVFNAIRYTKTGRVVLGCRRQGNEIAVQVHDSGIGISEQEQKYIFEEFYQVENPERDRSKGLGLGLAIVKRLSDLIGAHLSVKSRVDKGSMFEIRIPYVANLQSTIEAPANYIADVKNAKVLIIDDETIVRIGTRQVLEGWGCRVEDAETIEQALEIVKISNDFDIILSDFRLRAGSTGIDAINLIHAAIGKAIPAILLTGDTSPMRLGEAKKSGFKLLHKPVSPAKLRSLMSYYLDRTPAPITKYKS